MKPNAPASVAPSMCTPRVWARRLAVAGAALLLAAAFLTCAGPPWYYADKYSRAGPAGTRPLAIPRPIQPVRQAEPHTCGLCAVSAVYRAYGLDPQAHRVRFRIGVDKPVINLMSDTRGTIHPDLFRVLRQDGFELRSIGVKGDASEQLTTHLDRGHFAIALVRASDLHWVVLCGREGDRVRICDSLRDDLYDEPLATCLAQRVYSLILIEPGRP